MHELSTALNVVNSVLFVVLAVVAVRRWLRKRDDAAGWLTLSFLALGLLVTAGRLVPAHPHGFVVGALLRLEIELLVLFPYLGYRFATAFVPPSRRLQRVVGLLTIGLSIWTFALPSIPAPGDPRPSGFVVYVSAFLIHWTLLSVVVTTRLWRAGRGQPSVARTRMRLLSFAAAALTVAIIGSALATNSSSPGAVVVQAIALLSAVAFLLGFEPPQIVRASWRAPEQQRLQEAIRGLMTLATTRAEVAQRVLGPVAALVGARAACIFDADGNVLAQQAVPEQTEDVEPVRVEEPGVVLHVWTSPYAPFFGEDELRALHTVAALTGIALDRVRLFEQEHQSRLALERANELMTNFVALAAHELRTPVTTVHGFVQTLNHLGDRLDDGQKDELRLALEQQTARMAALVEQLLDLSRLDAEAVEVKPQELDLRHWLEVVVAVAAGSRLPDVRVEVLGPSVATIDPAILDHIVTNLVTNALRYGQAPVLVSAAVDDGQVRISVEDVGPGVAFEIEETLFERFTRAGVARDRVAGTGLGLAIARAYARAHSGDLRYERGQPAGARFVVELPTG
ncbi:MAG: Sensory box histidine kinase/response regulator [Actinomycetia bacterium]|nr:Sensory box histidine kinase/response regulator [Actinomycetes bacterium]